jgi:hypothetical protein
MSRDDPLDEDAAADADADAEAADDGVGGRVANGIRSAVDRVASAAGAGLTNFVGNLTAPIPFSAKLWGGLLKRSLYYYHKAAGGDRLGLEAKPSGQIEFTPVKWRSAEGVDADEKPGWAAKGREKVWRATTLGQSGPRIGKTPVIPLDTESWRATSILEARVAEAVDLGETRPLYRDPDGQLEAEITYQAAGGAGDQQAVADGGQQAVTNVERAYNPGDSPIFEDMIIDVGGPDWDGQAISWLKSKELMLSTTTQEEMANQEARGEIAGRSRDDMLAFAKRIFLYAALVALGGLIGPEVVAAVLGGGGGGGGGGIIPLSAGLI